MCSCVVARERETRESALESGGLDVVGLENVVSYRDLRK